MPALDKGVAALRIFGDDLDPEELNGFFWLCLYSRMGQRV